MKTEAKRMPESTGSSNDEKRDPVQVAGTGSDLHPRANYLVAGSLCSSFAIGSVGEIDDFFLVGSPPHDGTEYPLLTGTVLDADGGLLFRLVRNELTHNPGRCTKTLGSRMGYKIHDRRGKLVLRVRASFEMVAIQGLRSSMGMRVTRLEGRFIGKSRNVVFESQTGKEELSADAKSAFNWRADDAFGVVNGYDADEQNVAAAIVASKGAIHEALRGSVQGETLRLDGKILVGADLRDCRLVVETGDFMMSPDSSITRCAFDFQGNARRIAVLVSSTFPTGGAPDVQ